MDTDCLIMQETKYKLYCDDIEIIINMQLKNRLPIKKKDSVTAKCKQNILAFYDCDHDAADMWN